MTTNQLLLRDKELAAWWTSVVRDEHNRFDQILLLAKANALDLATKDHIEGAKQILESLTTMADSPEPSFKMPESGLIHDTQPTKR